jgi:sterol desaturase/sphingolipid hydroxylase (fatty acid hydroxylase superfamily)
VTWQRLSPIIIVGSALVFIALERRFPYDNGQKLFRKGFLVDFVGYALFESYVLGLAIAAIIGYLHSSPLLSGLHVVTSWPVPLQLFFFFVTHDFYIYCFHRLQHHSKYLWRTHEAHHSVADVDWLAGTRSHSLEILINQTIEFAPIALLGAAPEVAVMKATLDAVWGMYIHSNIDVREGWLQYVINGPEMHRWHHARELADRNRNFGTKLAIWDWLFKTAYLPPFKPKAYGLAGDEPYPEGYVAQHIAAFRPFRATSPQSRDEATTADAALLGAAATGPALPTSEPARSA